MRRPVVTLALAFSGLAAFALFMGWAFFQSSQPADHTRTLGPIWPYAMGALLVAGGLIGFLAWLVVYAARHDLDD